MKTESARCAAAIRAELKAAFPGVKFSVTSEQFAGGDSVHIRYADAIRTDKVEEISGKYEEGKFDGMQDLYEYTNSRDDTPQAKYVMVNRDCSDDLRANISRQIGKEWNVDMTDDQAGLKAFGCWPSTMIWREFQKHDYDVQGNAIQD